MNKPTEKQLQLLHILADTDSNGIDVTNCEDELYIHLTFNRNNLPRLVEKKAPDFDMVQDLMEFKWIHITRSWEAPSAVYYQLTDLGKSMTEEHPFSLNHLR